MSIAFANLGVSANPDINSSTDLPAYASTSWTPPTSGLIVVFVHGARTGGPDVPTVSGNSLTWTQIGTSLTFGTSRSLTLFGANASGSNLGVTTVDFGLNTQTGCIASFFHATDVDLAGGVAAAFVQKVNNSGNATSGTVTLAAAGHADNRPISCFVHFANEATTPQTNWTELDDLAGLTPTRALETQYRSDAFDTAAAASWTTSGTWGGMAAELKAVAGGTNTPKTVDGTLTSSGVMTTARGYARSLAGTLTTAGAIVKSVAKSVAGTLTSSGALVTARGYIRDFAGTLTSAGSLVKATAKALVGTVTSSGALTTARSYVRLLAGTLATAGDLVADLAGGLAQAVGGTLTMAGTITRSTTKSFAGTLTSAGAIVRDVGKALAGTLSTSGAITTARGYVLALTGTLTSTGTLVRSTAKNLVGTLAPTGAISRAIGKAVGGALSFLGSLLAALVGATEAHLDVTLTDSAVYTATLTDSAVYTVTLSDSSRS